MSSTRTGQAVILLLLVMLAAAFVQAPAQEAPVVIERFGIELWPEYDDPRLLVIYRGELAEDPKGPLGFAIGATAQAQAAAHVSSDGRLLADNWQVLPSDNGRRLVVFTPGSRQFHFEYYDNLISPGPKKSFIFQFQSSRYDVKDLEIEVRQPLRATGLQATPSLEARDSDARGFSYFGRKVGAVPAGTLVEQNVSYLKPDDEPSMKPATSGGLFTDFPWRIALGLGGLVLGLGGLAGLWWYRRKTWEPHASTTKPRSKKPHRTATQKQMPAQSQSEFCTQCGHQFRSEERFCSQCGKLRA